MPDNAQHSEAPETAMASEAYENTSDGAQDIAQEQNFERVTDSMDNHDYTDDNPPMHFKESLPIPPKVRSGYWDKVYNKTDSRKKKKGRIADKKSGKTYRDALLVLAKDICEADLPTSRADIKEKRRVLRKTRGVLNKEFVDLMAEHEIEIDLSAWKYRDLIIQNVPAAPSPTLSLAASPRPASPQPESPRHTAAHALLDLSRLRHYIDGEVDMYPKWQD